MVVKTEAVKGRLLSPRRWMRWRWIAEEEEQEMLEGRDEWLEWNKKLTASAAGRANEGIVYRTMRWDYCRGLCALTS